MRVSECASHIGPSATNDAGNQVKNAIPCRTIAFIGGLLLEIGIAELLFERKTDKDIAELERTVAKQSSLASLNKEDEIEFHGKLYEMSGNDCLKWFQILLFPIFDHIYKHMLKNPRVPIPDPISHQDLVKVLKSGTPDQYRAAMKKHLQPYCWKPSGL